MSPKRHHIIITEPKKKENTRKNNKKGQAVITCLLVLILLPAIFISLNESFGFAENVPDWNSIFSYFGLGKAPVSAAATAENEINVHFIDVGQGDCEFIQTPEYNILIDSGERDYYQSVVNYLKNLGVKKLDYVIVTHPHSDHAGGMSYIINSIKTEKVIIPEIREDLIPTTGTYGRLLDALIAQNCEIIYAEAGAAFELDGGARMEIIAPLGDYDDLNNYSVVMKLIHGENSFLFTGDIEKKAENDILDSGADISADVLKVAHHGSSTSSIKRFLAEVGGKYAVIEVGSPNTYNHPNDKVAERLDVYGYKIMRTDRNGNIIFKSDGNKLTVYNEKEYTENIKEDEAA